MILFQAFLIIIEIVLLVSLVLKTSSLIIELRGEKSNDDLVKELPESSIPPELLEAWKEVDAITVSDKE